MCEHGNTDDHTGQSRLDFTSDSLFLDAFRLRRQGIALTEFERKRLADVADFRRRKLERHRLLRSQHALTKDIAAQADPIDGLVNRLDDLIRLLRPLPQQPRRPPASRPSRPPPPPEFDPAPSRRHRIDVETS